MNTFYNRKLLLFIFLAFVMFIFNGCSRLNTLSSRNTPSEEFHASSAVGISNYIVANSMKELVDKSTIIVSGQAIAQKEIINMARDVNDINKPDPNILGVGQVYEFKVDKYLKEDGPETIFIVQPEGFLAGDQVGLTLNDANIKKARSQEKYIPIRINNPYILFLEQLKGFSSLKNYYTGAIHPWRFDLSNRDVVIPESPWEGALKAFPPRKATVLLTQIASPELMSTSYPPAYP